MKKSRLTI